MVAMSGGVDSAVAAALLVRQGYAVCGTTLKLFSEGDILPQKTGRTCCALSDVEDARGVARRLGIPYYVLNYSDRFRRDVICRFAAAYRRGETPNPCIDCNRYIKFAALLSRAMLLQLDCIATGHYAQTAYDARTGRYLLKKAVDRAKDQTYVLYGMTQEQLRHTRFPLGSLTKQEVRRYAADFGFDNAQKPDSQDICFVPDGDYASFLVDTLGIPAHPGHFTDRDGRILGVHRGLLRYTVGQRRGLGLSLNRPMYVLSKEASSNTVVLGDEAALYRSTMMVRDVNWISFPTLTAPMDAMVKTRYNQREAPAVLTPLADGRVLVTFQTPQRAITPGQAAVFYQGDVVLGGGSIV